jgi:hypothetical protein
MSKSSALVAPSSGPEDVRRIGRSSLIRLSPPRWNGKTMHSQCCAATLPPFGAQIAEDVGGSWWSPGSLESFITPSATKLDTAARATVAQGAFESRVILRFFSG